METFKDTTYEISNIFHDVVISNGGRIKCGRLW